MTQSIYRTPESTLAEDDNNNPLAKLEYHTLWSLTSGRRKVLILVAFSLFCALVMAIIAIFTLSGLAFLEPAAFWVTAAFAIFYGVVAYAAFSSSKWGLMVGCLASVLLLPAFPMGTVIGSVALRGFYQSRAIYLTADYNFKDLRQAYKKYT